MEAVQHSATPALRDIRHQPAPPSRGSRSAELRSNPCSRFTLGASSVEPSFAFYDAVLAALSRSRHTSFGGGRGLSKGSKGMACGLGREALRRGGGQRRERYHDRPPRRRAGRGWTPSMPPAWPRAARSKSRGLNPAAENRRGISVPGKAPSADDAAQGRASAGPSIGNDDGRRKHPTDQPAEFFPRLEGAPGLRPNGGPDCYAAYLRAPYDNTIAVVFNG